MERIIQVLVYLTVWKPKSLARWRSFPIRSLLTLVLKTKGKSRTIDWVVPLPSNSHRWDCSCFFFMFSRGSRTKPSFAPGTPGRGFRPKTIDRYLHQMNCRSASPKEFMTCDFQSQEVLLLKMFSKLEVIIYLTKNIKNDETSSSLGSVYHTIELRSKNEWVAKKIRVGFNRVYPAKMTLHSESVSSKWPIDWELLNH